MVATGVFIISKETVDSHELVWKGNCGKEADYFVGAIAFKLLEFLYMYFSH